MGLKNFDSHNPTQSTYEKLIEHLMDYCNENPVNYLNDIEYLKKIENEVNNYVNPYIMYDDANFNWLAHVVYIYIFLKTTRT